MKQITNESDLVEDQHYLMQFKNSNEYTLCVALKLWDTADSDLALYVVSYFNSTVGDEPFNFYERTTKGYTIYEVSV